MGYVPGRDWDLFLSYAHNDKEWVDAFRKQLKQGLLEKLGVQATMWQDEREIQLGQKWPDEIRGAIDDAAAFLAVCSPSYFRSSWCKRERETLLPDGDIAKIQAGRFYRFLKVIKTPSEGIDDNFLSKIQYVRFCSERDEFAPSSSEFAVNLKNTISAVSELLRTMRNSLQPLYIAPTADSLEEDYGNLCAQLKDYGYNVRPEIRLGPDFEDKVLKAEIELCKTGVYLLGAEHNAYLEHQIETARDLGSRMIFWPHPSALTTADAKQAALIAKLRSAKDLPQGSQMLGGSSIRDLIHDLMELLRPKPEASPLAGDSGASKVYLLYDTTDLEDAAFASQLGNIIRDRKMDVFVPDPNPSSNSDRLPHHENLMRACNAVLCYRGPASNPDNWLIQNAQDILLAELKFTRSQPFKAKTFLLADPTPLQGIGNIQLISCAGDFTPEKLGPFFEHIERT
jgi:hypothetical protein